MSKCAHSSCPAREVLSKPREGFVSVMRKKTQTFCTSTCSLSFGESGFLKRKLGSQSWPVVRVVLHRYSLPFIIQKQDVLDEGCRHLRKKTLSRNAFPYIPDLLSATIHLTGILCTTIKPLSLSLSFKFEESCCFSDWKGDVPFQEGEKKIPTALTSILSEKTWTLKKTGKHWEGDL